MRSFTSEDIEKLKKEVVAKISEAITDAKDTGFEDYGDHCYEGSLSKEQAEEVINRVFSEFLA